MLSLLIIAALAQPVEVPPIEEPKTSLVVAAAWCAIRTNDDEPNPGCDVGVGVSLFRRDNWALVAAIGSSTVGVGVARIVGRSELGVIAVSLGVIASYDDQGIDGQNLYPALGATLSFAKGGE